MLKYALAAAIAYRWYTSTGTVATPAELGVAALRTFGVAMLAWIVLEACHTLWRAAMSLEASPRR